MSPTLPSRIGSGTPGVGARISPGWEGGGDGERAGGVRVGVESKAKHSVLEFPNRHF